MTPSFLNAGNPYCPTGSQSEICTEFENNTQPSKFTESTEDYYDVAWALFTAINTLWWNVSDYNDNYIYTGYASDVLEYAFADDYNDNFTWSESLASAAWHVLNFEEPCGTYGD